MVKTVCIWTFVLFILININWYIHNYGQAWIYHFVFININETVLFDYANELEVSTAAKYTKRAAIQINNNNLYSTHSCKLNIIKTDAYLLNDLIIYVYILDECISYCRIYGFHRMVIKYPLKSTVKGLQDCITIHSPKGYTLSNIQTFNHHKQNKNKSKQYIQTSK